MSRKEQIALYCICGFAAEGELGATPEMYQKLKALLMEGHEGPGHGPATSEQAAEARRKSERAECKE
jgi:hypothetical protein